MDNKEQKVETSTETAIAYSTCYRLPFLSLSINNLKLKICTKFSQ